MLCLCATLCAQDHSKLIQRAQAVGVKASGYQEAFDILRSAEQAIVADSHLSDSEKAAWRYKVVRERMAMYMRMHRGERVKEQLDAMERFAAATSDETIKDDLLFQKANFFYAFGMDAQGDAIFGQMTARLMSQKEYAKVDTVYQTLIARGRKSGNASMVAQAYDGYIAWKDSANAMKLADTESDLKQQIQAGQQTIEERDATLSSRQKTIAALSVLAAVLAAALAAAVLLVLFLLQQRHKQQKTIRRERESNAMKDSFINNISAQIGPTLQRLDTTKPEVKALLRFTEDIQTLAKLESEQGTQSTDLEDTALKPFCEELVNQVRGSVKTGVKLFIDVPPMSAPIKRDYVAHILLHLLQGAAFHTPEDGHIRLEYKKRGPHKQQFMVSNTGASIPEEQRQEIFKPFRAAGDLTQGDGLGLPICQQMAINIGGELTIDPEFTRGTRFVLDLHS